MPISAHAISTNAIALIAGQGLLAFRDPFGIRPLILGKRSAGLVGTEWIVASESLVLESDGYEVVRDVAPGEAIFIARDGEMYSRQCAKNPVLIPCSFEYVGIANTDVGDVVLLGDLDEFAHVRVVNRRR